MISSADIANKYISFFKERGHVQIPNSPLVLQNDPTTLFTSSGMQPLVPYLLGEQHPQGKRLVNIQNCIRTQDIEEIGDNRHTTFFRMLGNWSLGDYFKKEEIPWLWEFLTNELQLSPQKLFITVFKGIGDIPQDEEAVAIWTGILTTAGLDPKERIIYYSDKSNWWSRAGTPEKMPIGEPGGPSSEVFYEFTSVSHNSAFGEKCHPNCDCGRFIEIGNSVFMQYIKSPFAEASEGHGKQYGDFKPLPKNNIDFGGGLERIAAAVHDTPDVFKTDLYSDIIKVIEATTEEQYIDEKNKQAMRVIADHMKAACFLIADTLTPSNKEHGYILRRLLRRAAVKMYYLSGNKLGEKQIEGFKQIVDAVLETEKHMKNNISTEQHKSAIHTVVSDEIIRFGKTLERGIKEVEKNLDQIDNKAFDLFQSYGFPFEILEEMVKEKGGVVDRERFLQELQHHKEQSRTASAGKFKGGLADQQDKTIMGHTATHLMHQALRDILGNHVHQSGSNITAERIRFDFNYDSKLTDEQIKQVESIVMQKIKENLPVHFEMIPTEEAKKMGAIGLFEDTYADVSKIYFIGDTKKSHTDAYSIEFCGGPHVEQTVVLKSFKIYKQENLGKGMKRLYAIVHE
jgi:alanyl-tRNA synthetase